MSVLLILFYGLTAAILWGGADYFAAKSSKHNGPVAAALWVSIISVIAYVIFFLFFSSDLEWTRRGILFAITSGVSLELGLLFFFKGLDRGPVSIVSPISSTYPLITTLLAVLLFGKILHFHEYIGIILIIGGTVIAAGILKAEKSNGHVSKGLSFVLLTVLLWGIAYALLGQAVMEIGWKNATLVDLCAGLASLALVLSLTAKSELKEGITHPVYLDRNTVQAAILQLGGGIIFSIGLQRTLNTPVLTAISACYPVLTVFLALKHFKEKTEITALMGAGLAIIGVVIISI